MNLHHKTPGMIMLLVFTTMILLACSGADPTNTPQPTARPEATQETDEPATEAPATEETDSNAGSISITVDDAENLDEIILEIAFGGAGGGGAEMPNACYFEPDSSNADSVLSDEVPFVPATEEFDKPTWTGWATLTEYSRNFEVRPNMNGQVWGAWSHCGCGFKPDEPVEFTVDLPNGETISLSPDTPMLEEFGVRFEIIDVQETEPGISRDNCYGVEMDYEQVVPPIGAYDIKLQQGNTALEDTWIVSLPDERNAFSTENGVQFLGFQPNEEVDVKLAVSYDAEIFGNLSTGAIEDIGWHLVGTFSGTADQLGNLFVELERSQYSGIIVFASGEDSSMGYHCAPSEAPYIPCGYDGDLLAALSGDPVPTPIPPSDDDYDVDTSSCTLDYRFVSDITIPDNTRVSRGETFEKTWLIRNTGTCVWGPQYQIVQVDAAGNDLIAEESVFLTEIVQPGDEIEIAVSFTVSDDAPVGGRLYGTVQLQAPNGEKFGQKPYVQVVVAQ